MYQSIALQEDYMHTIHETVIFTCEIAMQKNCRNCCVIITLDTTPNHLEIKVKVVPFLSRSTLIALTPINCLILILKKTREARSRGAQGTIGKFPSYPSPRALTSPPRFSRSVLSCVEVIETLRFEDEDDYEYEI